MSDKISEEEWDELINEYGNRVGKNGAFYVCGACGKRSPDMYGDQAKNGWDESCMLNSVLVYDPKDVPPEPGAQYQAVPKDKINDYSTLQRSEDADEVPEGSEDDESTDRKAQ